MGDLASTVDWVAGDELVRARAKFGAFHSGHEGYAVVLEEVQELHEEVTTLLDALARLWAAVRSDDPHDIAGAAEHLRVTAGYAACEAIQVLAMTHRFEQDITHPAEEAPRG